MGIVTALVGPELCSDDVLHASLPETAAARAGDAAPGVHEAPASHVVELHKNLHSTNSDKSKNAHAHVQADLPSDSHSASQQEQAAHQSPALAATSKLLNYYSCGENIKDAMDVLVASPRSPCEHDGNNGHGSGGGVKCLAASPARSVASVPMLHSYVLDVDDLSSAVSRPMNQLNASESPLLQGMDRQRTGSLSVAIDSSLSLANDIDKLDALVDNDADSHQCLEHKPQDTPRASLIDPMLSALI